MLTFAFMYHPYLVCILFGMPSLHLFTFLMFFIFLFIYRTSTYISEATIYISDSFINRTLLSIYQTLLCIYQTPICKRGAHSNGLMIHLDPHRNLPTQCQSWHFFSQAYQLPCVQHPAGDSIHPFS